jgi:hypothetical protein
MTAPHRLYRLWRTSGILCTLGAAEFGYLWWIRREWWLLVPVVLLVIVAGLALRKARALRSDR